MDSNVFRSHERADPEGFLEELFTTRHDLVTLSNRAAQNRQACLAAVSVDDRRQLLA